MKRKLTVLVVSVLAVITTFVFAACGAFNPVGKTFAFDSVKIAYTGGTNEVTKSALKVSAVILASSGQLPTEIGLPSITSDSTDKQVMEFFSKFISYSVEDVLGDSRIKFVSETQVEAWDVGAEDQKITVAWTKEQGDYVLTSVSKVITLKPEGNKLALQYINDPEDDSYMSAFDIKVLFSVTA